MSNAGRRWIGVLILALIAPTAAAQSAAPARPRLQISEETLKKLRPRERKALPELEVDLHLT